MRMAICHKKQKDSKCVQFGRWRWPWRGKEARGNLNFGGGGMNVYPRNVPCMQP